MAWLDEAMARCEAGEQADSENWDSDDAYALWRAYEDEWQTDLPHALRLLREAVALLSHAKQCACWPACTPRFGERRDALLAAIEKGPA